MKNRDLVTGYDCSVFPGQGTLAIDYFGCSAELLANTASLFDSLDMIIVVYSVCYECDSFYSSQCHRRVHLL